MKLIGPETVSQGCIRPVGNGTNSAGLRQVEKSECFSPRCDPRVPISRPAADLRAITRIIFYRCLFKFVAVSGLIEKETHEKGIGN